MPCEITLPQDTRVFTRKGKSLSRAEVCVKAGEVLIVSDPETVTYDHRDQLAVSLRFEGHTYWMLVEETKVPELLFRPKRFTVGDLPENEKELIADLLGQYYDWHTGNGGTHPDEILIT